MHSFKSVVRFIAAGMATLLVAQTSKASLINPGFENGTGTAPANWSTFGDASRQTFQPKTGSYSMWLQTFSSNGGGFFQNQPAVAGDTYTLDVPLLFEANFASTGATIQLKLEYYDAGNTSVGTPAILSISAASNFGTNTWIPFDVSGTAPTGVASVRSVVLFSAPGSTGSARSAFADDLTLTESVPEPATFSFLSVGFAATSLRRCRRGK